MNDETTITEEELDPHEEAELYCRWAAARAGAIALVPGAGAAGLITNEIYMIVGIGKLYNVSITTSMAKGFIMGVFASIIGQTIANFIPGLNVIVAISVTYGIGKAAEQWIIDGMPEDTSQYKKVYKENKHKAKNNAEEFKNDPKRDQPLGDESIKY